ncbi:MAG: zinc ribbon domain-containing protein [Firmicutes bacterium]|nr:zinc ribbon domain-containing protein [Bacillota bacterium]
MPLYEYKCLACEKNFDKICRAGIPDSEITCPACGKNEAKRKLSMFSFGSRNSSGDFKSAPSSGGCGSCSSHNCSNCSCH